MLLDREFISRVRQVFFDIFTSAKHEWKYKKSCLTSEINSLSNNKNIEFSIYYISFIFFSCPSLAMFILINSDTHYRPYLCIIEIATQGFAWKHKARTRHFGYSYNLLIRSKNKSIRLTFVVVLSRCESRPNNT